MKNIAVFGFGELATKSIINILDSEFSVNFILTHKEMLPNSVDSYCINNNIDFSYLNPQKNINEVIDILKDKNIELLITINYRFIIPLEIIESVFYAFNIHGSLLPKYRGRTPHVWSIINGETETGITTHLLEKSVDTGDIIYQKKILIDNNDTGYTLLQKYINHYPNVILNSIENLINGKKLIKQNHSNASFFGKRTPDMGYIDFYKNAKEVINFVRAQAEPYPGAYYYLVNGKKITINAVKISSESHSDIGIGVIFQKNGVFYVYCKDALLKLTDYKVH